MSSKNNTEVIIDGKIYILSGYESEEYLQKVAMYINAKISDFKKDDSYKKMNMDMQKALLDLNIADDYFKVKKQADILQADIDAKDKQLYDLKHDLVAANLKIESYEKEISRLKRREDNRKSRENNQNNQNSQANLNSQASQNSQANPNSQTSQNSQVSQNNQTSQNGPNNPNGQNKPNNQNSKK